MGWMFIQKKIAFTSHITRKFLRSRWYPQLLKMFQPIVYWDTTISSITLIVRNMQWHMDGTYNKFLMKEIKL